MQMLNPNGGNKSFKEYVRWCWRGKHFFKTAGKTRGKRVCLKCSNKWKVVI